MDNENRTPQQTNIETKAVPHAGSSKVPEDVREVPYREFDNTSLPEAIAKDLVAEQLPEGVTPAALLEPTTESQSETTETKQADSEVDPTKKSKKGLVISLGAGALVVAGAVASIFGFNSASHNDGSKNEPPQSDPKATSQSPEASPSPSASTTEKELTVGSLEIKAGLSPEQLGVTLVQDRLSEWQMAGATDANTKAWSDAADSDGFTNTLANKNADTFADALFVDNWRDGKTDASLSSLVTFRNNQQEYNAGSIENFFKTNHLTESDKAEFPTDFVPYERSVSVDPSDVTVVSQDADSVTLSILATDHDNSSRNRVGAELSNGIHIDGHRFKTDVTLKNIDGVEKISSISVTSLNQ